MDEFYNEERINKGGYMLDLYRLSHAQIMDDTAVNQISLDFGSALCGQKLEFAGIISKFEVVGKDNDNRDVYRFKMYYASTNIGREEKLTFRKMVCIIHADKLDEFLKVLPKKIARKKVYTGEMEEENYDDSEIANLLDITISCQVRIRGSLVSPDTFKVTSIITDIPRNVICEYKHPLAFDSNLIPNVIRKMNHIKSLGCNNIAYSRLENILNTYKEYMRKVQKNLNRGKYGKANKKLLEQLDRMLSESYISVRRVNLSMTHNKMKLIIDDIAMMHTSIQSVEFDQIGVLYDNTCVSKINELLLALTMLLEMTEDPIDSKQIVIIGLVFFKSFYDKYVTEIRGPKEALEPYMRYTKSIDEILKNVGFNIGNIEPLFNQINRFVKYCLEEF